MKKNRGLFVRKRLVPAQCQLEISFKDGLVDIFYPASNTKEICSYFHTPSDHFYDGVFRISCSDTVNYDWTVYRLSDKKLVAAICKSNLKNKMELPVFLGRHIFYKKE